MFIAVSLVVHITDEKNQARGMKRLVKSQALGSARYVTRKAILLMHELVDTFCSFNDYLLKGLYTLYGVDKGGSEAPRHTAQAHSLMGGSKQKQLQNMVIDCGRRPTKPVQGGWSRKGFSAVTSTMNPPKVSGSEWASQ